MNKIQLNDDQKAAFELLQSGRNCFLTGIAGSGKTFLVKYFKNFIDKRTMKNMAVTSTTGVSAALLNGSTLHSYLGIGLGVGSFKKLYEKISKSPFLTNRWQKTDILVIDEVSMLSYKLLTKLEALAQKIRKNDQVFGGMQIILVGDFCQLEPIKEDKFLFEDAIWGKLIQNEIYLQKSMRQIDGIFVKMLNEIRLGIVSEETEKILCSRCLNLPNSDIIPTTLLSTNSKVDFLNKKYYSQLDSQEYIYDIQINWRKNIKYKEKYDDLIRFQPQLALKQGAQVMFLVNSGDLVNGSRGVITGFNNGLPMVKFTNGITKTINKEVLDIEEDDDVIMSYKQIPLKLAWAQTYHKAQGQTLTLLRLDFDKLFANGQAYVGLSRAVSLEALYIKNFDKNRIKAHPAVIQYYEKIKTS